MAQMFLIVGCAIFGIIAAWHFIYVFATHKFDAIDKEVVKSMQNAVPQISKKTNLWKAWIGFNYSHALGVIWVPFIYVPLIIGHFEVLLHNIWLVALLPFMALCYAILAKKYWFSLPFIGAIISFLCFSVAIYLMHFN